MPLQQIFSKKAVNRRLFLQKSLILPIVFLIAACAGSVSTSGSGGNTAASPLATTGAQAPVLTNAPTCNGVATLSQTEGPFYKPNSPERTSLRESGISGTPLTVQGTCFLQHASLLLMHCWISGKQIAMGITITQVSGCGATSIQTIRGAIPWIRLSLESIQVEHGIFM